MSQPEPASPSAGGDVSTTLVGGVRTVLLNRPQKRNALTRAMIAALEAAFAGPPAANERLAVIRAEGSVFCAGLDLKDRSEHPQGASPIEHMLQTIEHYPLPVVAVVQGDAFAGGNELALHCDLVVASAVARFAMPLAQIGLAPSWPLVKKLLEAAGPVTTRRLLLLGDPLPARRLYELGIISHLAEPQDLQRTAEEVVARLAANAPLALRAMKALLLREMAFRDAIAHADVDLLVEDVRRSHDAQEGMAARLAQRRPTFTGS
jgi:enoyl-CoA hydratase/carnithine racemase